MFRNLKSLKIYKLLPADLAKIAKFSFLVETLCCLLSSLVPIILILCLTFIPAHYKFPQDWKFFPWQEWKYGSNGVNPYPPTSVFQLLTGYGSYTPLSMNLSTIVIGVYVVIIFTLFYVLIIGFQKYSSRVFKKIINYYLNFIFLHLKIQNKKKEVNHVQ